MHNTRTPPGPEPLSASQRTAARIRAYMGRDGRPAGDLAEHLGLSTYSISRRLNGRHDFKIEELTKIAAWLGIPISYLTDNEPEAHQ